MAKIQSMTGFGSSERSSEASAIEIEIKSVNNRFLDIQFKLPKTLIPLETKLKSILESRLNRGSVYCTLQYESKSNSAVALKLNEELLSEYLNIIKKLGDKIGEPARLDVAGLLKTPDLVTQDNSRIDITEFENEIIPVFEEACDSLVSSRELEGDNLVQSIKEKLSSFGGLTDSIKSVLPERQKEVREKYQKRIENLIQGESSISAERVMTEIGLLSERLDIDEEIVRFNSHLKLFTETLDTSVPGKKLGFVLQEMLREVNTMGSKCQYAPIQHNCVSLKEEIEKIREQCMNLE